MLGSLLTLLLQVDDIENAPQRDEVIDVNKRMYCRRNYVYSALRNKCVPTIRVSSVT